jgi:hypothetical protein
MAQVAPLPNPQYYYRLMSNAYCNATAVVHTCSCHPAPTSLDSCPHSLQHSHRLLWLNTHRLCPFLDSATIITSLTQPLLPLHCVQAWPCPQADCTQVVQIRSQRASQAGRDVHLLFTPSAVLQQQCTNIMPNMCGAQSGMVRYIYVAKLRV